MRQLKNFLKGNKWDIHVRVPVRISLIGGGTDMPVYAHHYGGIVIASPITRYLHFYLTTVPKQPYVLVALKDTNRKLAVASDTPYGISKESDFIKAAMSICDVGRGVQIVVESTIPIASGLGTSSAFTAGLISAFYALKGQQATKRKIALDTISVERNILMQEGGYQDQFAVCFGGLNQFSFNNKLKVTREKLMLKSNVVSDLEKRLILFYFGPREDGQAKQKYLAERIAEDAATVFWLHELKSLCLKMKENLLLGNLDECGRILDLGWKLKKRINPLVSLGFADRLYKEVKRKGALGGKVLGAGGGGCFLFYCPDDKITPIEKFLAALPGKVIPFKFDHQGILVEKRYTPSPRICNEATAAYTHLIHYCNLKSCKLE